MAKKTVEINSKDIKELRQDLRKAKQDLGDLYLDHSQFKLKNTRQIFSKRKEIARVLTAMRIKELAQK